VGALGTRDDRDVARGPVAGRAGSARPRGDHAGREEIAARTPYSGSLSAEPPTR
jgi:hypothetical protein